MTARLEAALASLVRSAGWRSGVEDERGHPGGLPGRRLSSCSALAISAGVSAPCSAYQSSRNRARASACALLAGASARKKASGWPLSAAEAPTASPDSRSDEIPILPTLTSWILGRPGGRLGLLGHGGLATRAGRRGGDWGG